MKLIKTFIICSFFLAISSPANAQFWKKLKKKVQNKVEQKIEQKIDKETDKIIDSTLYGKRKKNNKGKPTSNIPKFTSDTGILKLYNHGYEYVTKDISISVYGKYDKNNLSKSVKTYNSDRVIAPVDAFPEGYALANNDDGYLNPKEGQLQIHLADSTKIVYSLKGTWNTFEGNKPVSASFVSLAIVDIVDKRNISNNRKRDKTSKKTNKQDEISESGKNYIKDKISPTVNIPSSFSFTKSIQLEFTDDRGDSYPMEFLLGNYPDIWGMSVAAKEMGGQGKVIMVMTPKSSTAFMDVAGMKMKKSTSLQQMGNQYNMTDKLPDDGDFECKKTGNTKTILGYNCEEYRVDYNNTNDKGSAIFWVAKDFPIQNKELPMLGMKLNNPYFNGFVLEFNTISQGKKYTIKVTNVSDKNISINTSEYRNMGF